MIEFIKSKLRRRKILKTARKYIKIGLDAGDAASYWYMGPSIGWEKTLKKFYIAEKRYVDLGYMPIHPEDWKAAGGYVGRSHLDGLLYQPQKDEYKYKIPKQGVWGISDGSFVRDLLNA